MIGVDRGDGRHLDGNAHLAQSVADILSTPIGSRVMRRDYGSMLPELLARPANPITRQLVFAATAVAIGRWEPRIRIRRVDVSTDNSDGSMVVDLDAERIDLPLANDRVQLSIPIRTGGAAVPAP